MAAKPLTGWRRIANALWEGPNDPQIYGLLEIDATELLAFIKSAESKGKRITPTHLVGRALAKALEAVPDLNVRIVGGTAHDRPSIDIFYITSVEGGRDLSGVKVERVSEKSVYDVADELASRAKTLRSGEDKAFKKTKSKTDALPMPFLRVALRFAAWLAGKHGKNVPILGAPASPFGSAMVTSVGMLGIPIGFAPLAWMYEVPVLVLVGEISDKPLAIDGKVEVRPVLPITATIDHRWADGWHLGKAMKAFKAYLASPAEHEKALLLFEGQSQSSD
jgi:pyruvate dehydrogenase E2 component (dihydrolipoamide acetyltransferase)